MRPETLDNCPVGTRVCAYWSNKYHYLHPGVVAPPHGAMVEDTNYLNIELDDGDSRDIHIDSIRYLPQHYPTVGRLQYLGHTEIFKLNPVIPGVWA